MLSDSKKLAPLDLRRNRRDPVKGGRTWFSDQQKIEAVQMYLLVGSMPPVAAALRINIETLNKWRYTDWWKELTDQIKAEGRVKLNGKLQRIVSKSLEILEDRLENGDFQYDPKTGQMIRRPVSARDVARIGSDFIDKSLRIESQAQEAAGQQAVEDRLRTIAEAFASFSNKVRRVEVEDVDAIQIEATEVLDVCEQAEDGEGMGSGVEGEGDPYESLEDGSESQEEVNDTIAKDQELDNGASEVLPGRSDLRSDEPDVRGEPVS